MFDENGNKVTYRAAGEVLMLLADSSFNARPWHIWESFRESIHHFFHGLQFIVEVHNFQCPTVGSCLSRRCCQRKLRTLPIAFVSDQHGTEITHLPVEGAR